MLTAKGCLSALFHGHRDREVSYALFLYADPELNSKFLHEGNEPTKVFQRHTLFIQSQPVIWRVNSPTNGGEKLKHILKKIIIVLGCSCLPESSWKVDDITSINLPQCQNHLTNKNAISYDLDNICDEVTKFRTVGW